LENFHQTFTYVVLMSRFYYSYVIIQEFCA
jgi:hypothetical protein